MLNQPSSQGILLLNLGTPEQPNPRSVKRYLDEFLMDPWVIDLPFLLRWMLVKICITPRRSHTSAEAYRSIWTQRGSPLRFHLQDLTEALQAALPDQSVFQAMRYGKPSLMEAFQQIREQGINRLKVFPLYPQYSLAATESSLQEVRRVASLMGWIGDLTFVPPFFNQPEFIEAYAAVFQQAFSSFQADHLLFSFHGLPERHLKKVSSACLSQPHCCEKLPPRCYRAQCLETARLLALAFEARRNQLSQPSPLPWSVCFQSRLGRDPWIQPDLPAVLVQLAKQPSVRRLVVVCPSFVADCLETLEEVGLRARQQWLAQGGLDLLLIPSLNASPEWVDALKKWSLCS